jgi:hypothetical protein
MTDKGWAAVVANVSCDRSCPGASFSPTMCRYSVDAAVVGSGASGEPDEPRGFAAGWRRGICGECSGSR